ncbi:MAG: hypothetical protein ACNI3A_03920 [Desulfovibrio sp.]|uniref:hypothetical protein n=1 Tax=Desulfovibrio sp. 7SRBS1 TaxID=3378064 RepID=UPI003B40AD40
MSDFLSELELFCEEHRLDDSTLGKAYESVGARGRSILKTSIAALYDAYPPDAVLSSSTRHAVFDSGHIEFRRSPVQAVFIVFPSHVSAASLLALAVPAMTSGATEVVCICSAEKGNVPRHETLAALELAGVENILSCSGEKLSNFLRRSDVAQGSTLCIGLALQSADMFFPSDFTPTLVGSPHLGVFFPEHAVENYGVDFDALETAFAGDSVTLWNAPTCGEGTPHFFSCQTGSWEKFCSAGYEGVLVAQEFFEPAGKIFPLVLGPGCEGLWLYPQCRRELFLRQQLFASF